MKDEEGCDLTLNFTWGLQNVYLVVIEVLILAWRQPEAASYDQISALTSITIPDLGSNILLAASRICTAGTSPPWDLFSCLSSAR